ncbi:MAG: FAD/NAD(P)-binding protein, partial [Waterburya sp.]
MKILETRLTLEDFILKLQKVNIWQLELAQLQDWVARLDLEDLAIAKHICFSPENYQRQILYRDLNCEIILVCWQPGQFSPIHDHGDSLNVTHVYQGVLTSRTFAQTDSVTGEPLSLLLEEKYLQPSELIGVDRAQIHQLANTSEQNLITLNIYAKPLQQMQVYNSLNKQSQLAPIQTKNQTRLVNKVKKLNKFESQPTTIAIVGGGFSGSMVAVHLLKNAVYPLRIKLIERRRVVGEGIAYSTNWDCHLLNVPAGKMSAFPDRPDHFWQWLQTRESAIGKKFSQDDFVPRKLYGEYVKSILAEAEAEANTGVSVERLTDEAIGYASTFAEQVLRTQRIALEMTTERAIINLSSGKSLEADRVVLALGNFPPADPPVADPSFYQSQRYFRFWSTPALLSSIAVDEAILIIGSGLTALDAILALERQGHQGKIYVVSRRGLFPQTHQPTTAYPPLFESEALPTTIRSLVRRIRQEIKTAEARGDNWQSIINSLRPQIQLIWQSLASAEKQRFLRHVKPYWESHRHRVHSAIARQIEQKVAAEQLHLLAGRIQAYNEDAEGVNVSIRERCSNYINNLRVGTVINCTGSEC